MGTLRPPRSARWTCPSGTSTASPALQHADSLGERIENLVAPVTWGRQPARRVDGPLRIEVLGEEGPGPELVSRLEPGDELAPEHRTAAVEVKAPVPRRQRAAGQAEVDGDGVNDDRGSPGAALDQRNAQQLAGEAAVLERHRRQLVEGELSVGAGGPGGTRVGEVPRVHTGAQAAGRAL